MPLLIFILLLLAPDADARDRGEVRLFRSQHPCPATGLTTGPCKNWRIDHVIPLCAGGDDTPGNMAWQPLIESRKKDREELALCRELRKRAIPECVVKHDLCLVSKRARWNRLTKVLCVDRQHEAWSN